MKPHRLDGATFWPARVLDRIRVDRDLVDGKVGRVAELAPQQLAEIAQQPGEDPKYSWVGPSVAGRTRPHPGQTLL